MISPFHLAISVRDLASTRQFYGELLQCQEGRSTAHWIDWDFFGHQISTHLSEAPQETVENSAVDGCEVPIPHFGAILPWEEWLNLKQRLETQTVMPQFSFLIVPQIRYEGQVGEQGTMFFLDPSGNALEFKSFQDPAELFEFHTKDSHAFEA